MSYRKYIITPIQITGKEGKTAEVLLYGTHQCPQFAGDTINTQFTLLGGNEGCGINCGCYFVVPRELWNEMTDKYRFAQRLEGK